MVRLKFSSALFWLVAAVLCAGLGVVPLSARGQTPTPDQLEIFRELSPEQQQRILESLGNQGTDAESSANERRTSRSDSSRRNTRAREQLSRGMEQGGEPRFKPLDTLLLSLEVREFRGQGEPTPSVPAATPQGAPAPQVPPAATPGSRERTAGPIWATSITR